MLLPVFFPYKFWGVGVTCGQPLMLGQCRDWLLYAWPGHRDSVTSCWLREAVAQGRGWRSFPIPGLEWDCWLRAGCQVKHARHWVPVRWQQPGLVGAFLSRPRWAAQGGRSPLLSWHCPWTMVASGLGQHLFLEHTALLSGRPVPFLPLGPA